MTSHIWYTLYYNSLIEYKVTVLIPLHELSHITLWEFDWTQSDCTQTHVISWEFEWTNGDCRHTLSWILAYGAHSIMRVWLNTRWLYAYAYNNYHMSRWESLTEHKVTVLIHMLYHESLTEQTVTVVIPLHEFSRMIRIILWDVDGIQGDCTHTLTRFITYYIMRIYLNTRWLYSSTHIISWEIDWTNGDCSHTLHEFSHMIHIILWEFDWIQDDCIHTLTRIITF